MLVKAVAGGGGKGMRTVASEADLKSAIRAARSEAQSAFGDASIYLERRVAGPRHIEIQLMADEHGTVSVEVTLPMPSMQLLHLTPRAGR